MITMSVNGELTSVLAGNDRAIHYGDGLFETLALRNGKIELWSQHMARLQHGCQRLKLPVIDEALWLSDIKKLVTSSDAVIKLLQTRGAAGRGYAYQHDIKSTRIVTISALPGYPAGWSRQGVRIRRCTTPVSVNTVLAGVKHLNRLDNVLARNEWQDVTIAEGLMCDADENVIEGTMSNVFAIKAGVLFTPNLRRAGVCGVMREQIIHIANRLGLSMQERDINIKELETMDEIFLSNSLIRIWPVIAIDGHNYTVGKITRLLQQHLQQDLITHVSTL
jgi:4-amino-4-deoxychorismate lyase